MTPEEAKKLLGGYATGTLTAAEQQALFAAALEDQELFDSLAREQALRDALDDPAIRAELLDAVNTPSPAPRRSWISRWWPVPVGAGALAIAGLTVMVMTRREPAVTEMAQNRAPVAVEQPAPAEPQAATPPKIERAQKPEPAPRVAAVPPQPQANDAEQPKEEVRAKMAAAPVPAPVAEQRLDRAPSRLFRSELRSGAMSGANATAAVAGPPGMRFRITGAELTVETNFAGSLQVFRREAGEWVPVGPARAAVADVEVRFQLDAGVDVAVLASVKPQTATGAELTRTIELLRAGESRQLRANAGADHFVVAPDATHDAVIFTLPAGQR